MSSNLKKKGGGGEVNNTGLSHSQISSLVFLHLRDMSAGKSARFAKRRCLPVLRLLLAVAGFLALPFAQGKAAAGTRKCSAILVSLAASETPRDCTL